MMSVFNTFFPLLRLQARTMRNQLRIALVWIRCVIMYVTFISAVFYVLCFKWYLDFVCLSLRLQTQKMKNLLRIK